jgi:hypothetical protein
MGTDRDVYYITSAMICQGRRFASTVRASDAKQ